VLIPPGFTNVIIKSRIAGSPREAQVAWAFSGAAGDDDEAALVADFVESALTPTVTESTSFVEVILEVGQDGTDPLRFFHTFDHAGEIVGGTLPPNTGYLIQKRTALGGREGRGRLTQMGVPEAEVDDVGALDAGYQSICASAWTDFVSQLVAEGGLPFSAPRLLHNSATAPTLITGIACDALVATQRRRLR
jgi:hypothetical protein